MQMHNFSTGEIIITFWFAISVLIAVLSTVVFSIWLRLRGIKLHYFMKTTPGYLDYQYLKWCRDKGQSPNKGFLTFRVVSIISVIIAGAAFMLIVN